jgi:hypothetical protein
VFFQDFMEYAILLPCAVLAAAWVVRGVFTGTWDSRKAGR